MKKGILFSCLLVLTSVLSANAGMVIAVKIGDGLWADYPDSKLIIQPSQEIQLGVLYLTGQAPQPGSLALGLTDGPGSLSATGVVTYRNVTAALQEDLAAAEAFGVQNPFIAMEIATSPKIGMLVRSIVFHCDGPGDVTVAIVDEDGQVLDTQVIHQIPEPITVVFLGLGGLFLRRRIA
jgi:hypothetical protein